MANEYDAKLAILILDNISAYFIINFIDKLVVENTWEHFIENSESKAS